MSPGNPTSPAMSTPFYRIRFLLQATRDFRVPARQGALLYATLAAANQMDGAPAAFPRDLLLDTPEDNRTLIRVGQPFAFGGTLLANSPAEATAVVLRLWNGLQKLGQQGKPRRDGLGGNFCVASVQDLISGQEWGAATGPPPITLTPLNVDRISHDIQALLGREEITLEFLSPLRLERPGRGKQHQESFFDRRFFDAPYFLRRLLRRMSTVGLQTRSDADIAAVNPDQVEVTANRLIWLDLAYGGTHGKSLGGAVGLVRLKFAPGQNLLLGALAWGQWTRIGKNTHFGFGRYRILELGAEPCACARSISLLSTAWTHPLADSLSAKAELEAGILSLTIRDLEAGTYTPHSPAMVEIGVDPKRRQLQIPSRRDRLLQRLVLEAIGPAVDSLFESSSFAWRRGLGRHSSARAVSHAFRQGFRYAVNADIDRYFESINHEALSDRLRAYVADPQTQALLLQWVKSGSPGRTCGIPTGAPLSPLLGNLFLDEFDEQVAKAGGRLVRYGDDFLILTRTEPEATRLLQIALAEAEAVQLRLNEQTAPVIPLDEPFTFLGFRFEHHDQWRITEGNQVRQVEELGWKDAKPTETRRPGTLQLPGESGTDLGMGLTAIVGPGATHLEWRPGSLRCHYSQGREPTEIPLAGLETLVVLGRLGISAEIFQRLCEQSVCVVLAEDRGLVFGTIGAEESLPGEVLVAQVTAQQRPDMCLQVARSLIVAKLHNYRRLAAALPHVDHTLVSILTRCEEQAQRAPSIDELRGIEGYGAATWYQDLRRHLGPGFTFERRVAPDAEDPVNVLLNIAHTALYRLTGLAIRAAGLAGSLGFLHTSTTRFAALAADLQEPFRFLMDRVVIEATHILRPGDFSLSSSGPYRVAIAPDAARQFQLLLWKTLNGAVQPLGPTIASNEFSKPGETVPETSPFENGTVQAAGSSCKNTALSPVASLEPSASHTPQPAASKAPEGQPACYRLWIERQARQIRRFLLGQTPSPQVFQLQ